MIFRNASNMALAMYVTLYIGTMCYASQKDIKLTCYHHQISELSDDEKFGGRVYSPVSSGGTMGYASQKDIKLTCYHIHHDVPSSELSSELSDDGGFGGRFHIPVSSGGGGGTSSSLGSTSQ
jgi:hypothetical protein